jgi:hypothetical protein
VRKGWHAASGPWPWVHRKCTKSAAPTHGRWSRCCGRSCSPCSCCCAAVVGVAAGLRSVLQPLPLRLQPDPCPLAASAACARCRHLQRPVEEAAAAAHWSRRSRTARTASAAPLRGLYPHRSCAAAAEQAARTLYSERSQTLSTPHLMMSSGVCSPKVICWLQAACGVAAIWRAVGCPTGGGEGYIVGSRDEHGKAIAAAPTSTLRMLRARAFALALRVYGCF